jgi:hypothetical protein
MLAIHYLRQTSRHLVLSTSRSTFSTLPHPKSSKTDANSVNYPGFYNTTNADRVQLDDFNKSAKIDSIEAVPPNDLLEAERIEKNDKIPIPVVTSAEKFAAGYLPLESTSSISPTGSNLFHDAKVSNIPVSSGLPNIPSKTVEEDQIPSSGFSAFLRSIRSGLPFFPSRENISSPINIATTREYFLPVSNHSLTNHFQITNLLIIVNTSFINSFNCN